MTEDPFEGSALTPERIGQVIFVMSVPMFAYIGHLLFGDVLFGGLVGLLVGAGEFLFVPYVLRAGSDNDALADTLEPDHVRRGTIGLPLASGGIVAFAGRFVVDGYLVPFAAAGIYVAVSYVFLDRFLPGQSQDDTTA